MTVKELEREQRRIEAIQEAKGPVLQKHVDRIIRRLHKSLPEDIATLLDLQLRFRPEYFTDLELAAKPKETELTIYCYLSQATELFDMIEELTGTADRFAAEPSKSIYDLEMRLTWKR